MTTTRTTIALLGAGTMGQALLVGSLAGGLAPEDVWVSARRPEHVERIVDVHGVHGTTDNARAAEQADPVVLAAGPAQVLDIVAEISGHLREGAVVVSIADGIALADLEGRLPAHVGAARALPSITAQAGHGLTLLTPGASCTTAQIDAVTSLFARSGEVLHVEEEQHAVLGPLSSGGPAHLLYVADAMIEAAAVRGIPRDLGRRIVQQVMAGTAAWLEQSDEDAAVLRADVCAPGGAGIRRIATLDERAVRAALVAALTD